MCHGEAEVHSNNDKRDCSEYGRSDTCNPGDHGRVVIVFAVVTLAITVSLKRAINWREFLQTKV